MSITFRGKVALVTGAARPGGGPGGMARFIEREIPLRRLQTAGEIAATICWLLSEQAAAVTGEAVNASAGQTMV
jgi:NAD(P)-dependent dehydrogenase (short-subunit alcohol dehydrogenase family)